MNIFEFSFKRVYGRMKFYPSNNASKTICEIAERVCLDAEQLTKLILLDPEQVHVSIEGTELSKKQLLTLLTTGKRATA